MLADAHSATKIDTDRIHGLMACIMHQRLLVRAVHLRDGGGCFAKTRMHAIVFAADCPTAVTSAVSLPSLDVGLAGVSVTLTGSEGS